MPRSFLPFFLCLFLAAAFFPLSAVGLGAPVQAAPSSSETAEETGSGGPIPGKPPRWLSEGAPTLRTQSFHSQLRQAGEEGLDPRDYFLEELERLLGEKPSAARDARLEELFTEALERYARDLGQGRLRPRRPGSRSFVAAPPLKPAILNELLNAPDLKGALAELAPRHPGYHRLKAALAELRQAEAAGGWTFLPKGPALGPGRHDRRIPLLRARLTQEEASSSVGKRLGTSPSALPDPSADPELFDPALAEALRRFQRRHGLEPDAVLGQATLAELNLPLAERIRQVEANLERWRWLPRSLEARHLFVNVPAFDLELIEAGEKILAMPVIVGQRQRPTPWLITTLRAVVLNPDWTVPPTILHQDLIPLFRHDRTQAAKFEVWSGWGDKAQRLDPGTLDWSRSEVSEYRLRLSPGPDNPLGRVKFILTNANSIYLHDFPERALFSGPSRDLSSGCVRLDHPEQLVEKLLTGLPGWDMARIEKAWDRGKTRHLVLQESLPVYLAYFTAFHGNEEDEVQYRSDLYGWDTALIKALSRPRSPP